MEWLLLIFNFFFLFLKTFHHFNLHSDMKKRMCRTMQTHWDAWNVPLWTNKAKTEETIIENKNAIFVFRLLGLADMVACIVLGGGRNCIDIKVPLYCHVCSGTLCLFYETLHRTSQNGEMDSPPSFLLLFPSFLYSFLLSQQINQASVWETMEPLSFTSLN